MRILIWIDKLSNHLQIDIVNITPSQEGSPLRPLNDSEEVVHDLGFNKIYVTNLLQEIFGKLEWKVPLSTFPGDLMTRQLSVTRLGSVHCRE